MNSNLSQRIEQLLEAVEEHGYNQACGMTVGMAKQEILKLFKAIVPDEDVYVAKPNVAWNAEDALERRGFNACRKAILKHLGE